MKKHVQIAQHEIEICFFDPSGAYQHVQYLGEVEGVKAKVDEFISQQARDLTVFIDDEIYYESGLYVDEDKEFEEAV